VDREKCPGCGCELGVCPVCRAVFAAPAGHRGRPRKFCSDPCRWRAGHLDAAERHRGPVGVPREAQLAALAAALRPLDPDQLRGAPL
jgi:hypothetical protein